MRWGALRNDQRYAGKTAWTEAHRRWIARLVLPQAGAGASLAQAADGKQAGPSGSKLL
jgi:hypothetical protein